MITRILILIGIFSITDTIAQIPSDSLDVKIGQMIMVGVPTSYPDSVTLTAIRRGTIGAVLLFEKNIPPMDAYSRLKKMIWTYQKEASIPLFIAIDQEGGKVNRLKEKYAFPHVVSAAVMGSAVDSVRFYGGTTGAILAGLGININLAPVVDLAVNPSNPVIAKLNRAFSANADSVVHYAKEFIKTHRKVGVLTTLKHFPGHGSSNRDTHLGMVDVTQTWTHQELKPYITLIDEGYVDAVMTAHIVNKQLDKTGLPGTLSKSMLDGLLRRKIGYHGVVISDDMQMYAIAKHFGFKEGIRLAIQAGVDILIFSNNITAKAGYTGDEVHAAIRMLVEQGTIAESRIDKSFQRIMRLKKRLASPCNIDTMN